MVSWIKWLSKLEKMKSNNPLDEFSLISRYFDKKIKRRKEVFLGIGDDCSLIKLKSNQLLAQTTDTLVENTHFFPSMPADAVGYKALAVSLSDLAAMGAQPAHVFLSLTLPKADRQWVQKFCRGFFKLANQYDVDLIGGNLSRGPLSITVQAQGYISKKDILRRDAAKVGDYIFVSGELGHAGLALRHLRNTETVPKKSLRSFYYPTPRVALGMHLRKIANAAIDISDGLVLDLSHILDASHVGATLQLDKVPVAKNAGVRFAITAGEDYELCFTVSQKNTKKYQLLLRRLGCVCIGQVEKPPGLRLIDKGGCLLQLSGTGYQHFCA